MAKLKGKNMWHASNQNLGSKGGRPSSAFNARLKIEQLSDKAKDKNKKENRQTSLGKRPMNEVASVLSSNRAKFNNFSSPL